MCNIFLFLSLVNILAGLIYCHSSENHQCCYIKFHCKTPTSTKRNIFLDRFLEGLEACGVRTVVTKYPEQFQEVFCKKNQKLTAEMIETVFSSIKYSADGSNRKHQEEKTITYWCDFLMDVEGTCLQAFKFFIPIFSLTK